MSDDETAAFIAKLRADFDAEREMIRTRMLAHGYAFGRADQRLADGCEPSEDGHGSSFADFYERHANGSWTDLGPQYAAFQSRKDSSSE